MKDHRAWLGVVVAAAINFLGMPVAYRIDSSAPGVPAWTNLVSSAVGALLLVVLWTARKRPPAWLLATTFLINTAVIVTAFHLSNAAFARLDVGWQPFQGDKLGTLLAALLAPSFWTGLVSILAYTLDPVAVYLGLPADVRTRVAVGEPWIVVAFGFSATMVLIFRGAREALEERIARSESERLAISRLAAKLMSIKDLMNTPLQSLDLGIAILRQTSGSDPETLDRLDRAVEQLAGINETLARYEQEIEGHVRPLSFDAARELEP